MTYLIPVAEMNKPFMILSASWTATTAAPAPALRSSRSVVLLFQGGRDVWRGFPLKELLNFSLVFHESVPPRATSHTQRCWHIRSEPRNSTVPFDSLVFPESPRARTSTLTPSAAIHPFDILNFYSLLTASFSLTPPQLPFSQSPLSFQLRQK